MVKIQSNQSTDFGKTINFGGHELTFDRMGVAQVKDEKIAKELAERYEGWLFYGTAPKGKAKSEDPILENMLTEELEKAVAEVEKLKATISDREGQIKAIEKESTEWKEQVELFQEKAITADTALNDFTVTNEKLMKELQLENSLLKKTKAELVEFAITLEIPDDKYDGLNKEELINLILTESANQ